MTEDNEYFILIKQRNRFENLIKRIKNYLVVLAIVEAILISMAALIIIAKEMLLASILIICIISCGICIIKELTSYWVCKDTINIIDDKLDIIITRIKLRRIV